MTSRKNCSHKIFSKFNCRLDQSRREISELREKLDNSQIQATISQTQLSELQQNFAEKEQFLKETSEQLKTEFESLATKVLEKREQQQQQSLHNVLNPFKEQIVDFKKRVEEVYHTETKERSSLLTEIKILQTASEKINNEAQNLTRALKGDKKLQGNWGELVLERVLENSGLRRDHEYKVQNSYRTSEGELKRPDVVIRLPDGKDVVVDSKVSLNDYERALSCDDDHSRERFLRNFIGHLRNHVRGLSSQNYDQLPDVRSLDFVLLFIPIESAFTLAMESDQNLFNEAFGKRIVIVSPTTLMMTLRIINNVWRYEKQNRNAQEIAQKAGALYDKLRGLVEDMDKLGKQLHTARGTYEAVYGKLTSGKGNLVGQVEKFRQLGAVVKYPMPEKLLDGAEGDLDH